MSHISKVQFPRGNSKGSNNSIIYKENKFNPDVKKHEGDVLYQEEIPSEELGLDKNLSESILREGIRNSKKRKIKGAFMSAEKIIKLFKDADESTIVHELAHWWLEVRRVDFSLPNNVLRNIYAIDFKMSSKIALPKRIIPMVTLIIVQSITAPAEISFAIPTILLYLL